MGIAGAAAWLQGRNAVQLRSKSLREAIELCRIPTGRVLLDIMSVRFTSIQAWLSKGAFDEKKGAQSTDEDVPAFLRGIPRDVIVVVDGAAHERKARHAGKRRDQARQKKRAKLEEELEALERENAVGQGKLRALQKAERLLQSSRRLTPADREKVAAAARAAGFTVESAAGEADLHVSRSIASSTTPHDDLVVTGDSDMAFHCPTTRLLLKRKKGWAEVDLPATLRSLGMDTSLWRLLAVVTGNDYVSSASASINKSYKHVVKKRLSLQAAAMQQDYETMSNILLRSSGRRDTFVDRRDAVRIFFFSDEGKQIEDPNTSSIEQDWHDLAARLAAVRATRKLHVNKGRSPRRSSNTKGTNAFALTSFRPRLRTTLIPPSSVDVEHPTPADPDPVAEPEPQPEVATARTSTEQEKSRASRKRSAPEGDDHAKPKVLKTATLAYKAASRNHPTKVQPAGGLCTALCSDVGTLLLTLPPRPNASPDAEQLEPLAGDAAASIQAAWRQADAALHAVEIAAITVFLAYIGAGGKLMEYCQPTDQAPKKSDFDPFYGVVRNPTKKSSEEQDDDDDEADEDEDEEDDEDESGSSGAKGKDLARCFWRSLLTAINIARQKGFNVQTTATVASLSKTCHPTLQHFLQVMDLEIKSAAQNISRTSSTSSSSSFGFKALGLTSIIQEAGNEMEKRLHLLVNKSRSKHEEHVKRYSGEGDVLHKLQVISRNVSSPFAAYLARQSLLPASLRWAQAPEPDLHPRSRNWPEAAVVQALWPCTAFRQLFAQTYSLTRSEVCKTTMTKAQDLVRADKGRLAMRFAAALPQRITIRMRAFGEAGPSPQDSKGKVAIGSIQYDGHSISIVFLDSRKRKPTPEEKRREKRLPRLEELAPLPHMRPEHRSIRILCLDEGQAYAAGVACVDGLQADLRAGYELRRCAVPASGLRQATMRWTSWLQKKIGPRIESEHGCRGALASGDYDELVDRLEMEYKQREGYNTGTYRYMKKQYAKAKRSALDKGVAAILRTAALRPGQRLLPGERLLVGLGDAKVKSTSKTRHAALRHRLLATLRGMGAEIFAVPSI